MLFWGVTYKTCCYKLTLPLSEGSHLLFCVLYNVVSENHSVQNSPWGGGGSIASSRPNVTINNLPYSDRYFNTDGQVEMF